MHREGDGSAVSGDAGYAYLGDGWRWEARDEDRDNKIKCNREDDDEYDHKIPAQIAPHVFPDIKLYHFL
jgi:hypothetical protein